MQIIFFIVHVRPAIIMNVDILVNAIRRGVLEFVEFPAEAKFDHAKERKERKVEEDPYLKYSKL